jgi:ornithine--oxo-acid transaminase
MSDFIEKEQQFGAHNYLPLPVVLERGEGVWLWDENGTKYLDMMSAYSAVSHGHCHPELVEVMREQVGRLCVTSRAFHTDKLAPFFEKICGLSGLDKALPMNTGAEAVETAIKAVRLWGYKVKHIPEGKAEIIVAHNNFHGRTTTITGFSSEPLYKDGFGPFTPGFREIPFGDAKALELAITPHTCAFLVEPMQGEAGIIIPPAGWLAEVSAICKKHNVLLIADEVQTGLARTGKMFAFQHEGITPDVLILGKALGGGMMPVSAVVGKAEVMDQFSPGSHGSTFGGNPLAAAVGLKALQLLERDKLAEHSDELGKYFMQKLKSIDSNYIKDVRGKGLWIGVEIDASKASARLVCEKMMEKGVLSKETHEVVVRFAPPLVIDKSEIDMTIDVLKDVLLELENCDG